MTKRIGLFNIRRWLRFSLWFMPTLIVTASALTALGLILADHLIDTQAHTDIIFAGNAEGARQVIAIVVGSMVSFIGTVFSVTVIVLQLASSQFSPRALRNFLRDRRSQVPLGVFLGSLVYSLIVLWSIRSDFDGNAFVPSIAISGGLIFVLVAVVTFVYYIHHVSQSIRVANVVHSIGTESVEVLHRRYPDPYDAATATVAPPELRGIGHCIASSSYGVMLAADHASLVKHAHELGGRVELLPCVGDFVATGQPLARWEGDASAIGSLQVEDHVSLGRERTMQQDLAFGLRQLVDIAERALSPGVNDPTTAIQALDQIHNILRQLAHRQFPHEILTDAGGTPRAIIRERTWEDFVNLAFEEIRHYGLEAPQIQDRLTSILTDLEHSVPDERRPVIEQHAGKLSASRAQAFR